MSIQHEGKVSGYPPKACWGPGPWHDEPDEDSWTSSGLACRAGRNYSGNWCGYVALPDGHPLALDYDSWPLSRVRVHGGLTWSGPFAEGGPFYLGFDCGHLGDLRPAEQAYHRRLGSLGSFTVGTYRDLSYVRAECRKLASFVRRWGAVLERDYSGHLDWVLAYLNAPPGGAFPARSRRSRLRGRDLEACGAVYRLAGAEALDAELGL